MDLKINFEDENDWHLKYTVGGKFRGAWACNCIPMKVHELDQIACPDCDRLQPPSNGVTKLARENQYVPRDK